LQLEQLGAAVQQAAFQKPGDHLEASGGRRIALDGGPYPRLEVLQQQVKGPGQQRLPGGEVAVQGRPGYAHLAADIGHRDTALAAADHPRQGRGETPAHGGVRLAAPGSGLVGAGGCYIYSVCQSSHFSINVYKKLVYIEPYGKKYLHILPSVI